MTTRRLTKDDIRHSGVLNPVGHIVVAFENETVTADAVTALRAAGFAPDDILQYTPSEATERLRERVRSASQAAGFGYEIVLMRRYLALAEEGCGWLIVYAPDDAAVVRVTAIAKQLAARCAVRYHRLANEDLI
ncbi:MAG: hypothetical protein ABI156_05045 [Caldimonas sp.]